MHLYSVNYKLADGIIVTIQITDSGGIEKFKQINNEYYKNADCFFIVFDITDVQSFQDATNFFISKIEENCKKNYKILLVGNKTDLEVKREISYEKGLMFAKNHNYSYIETSCINNDNVFMAFQTLIEITHMKVDNKDKGKNEEDEIEDKKLRYNDNFEEKLYLFPKIMDFLNN